MLRIAGDADYRVACRLLAMTVADGRFPLCVSLADLELLTHRNPMQNSPENREKSG